MKTGVLIPACNESEIIENTIKSIFSQTRLPDRVLIIPNNCRDNTEEIALEMQESYKLLEVFSLSENKDKKAGALNFGLSKIVDDVDYIVCMDADTVLDEKLIEEGVKTLNKNPKLGAICSRAGVLKPEKLSIKQRLIWHLQHLEYGQFDSQRIETLNNIRVVHGMVAMFRTEALKDVLEHCREAKDEVYKKKNLVEDYELTICLKESGWQVSLNMEMLAWTTVPLSWKEWWVQRVRWLRGGVDSLREHGWNNVTKKEILQHFLFVFIVSIQIIIISLLFVAIKRGVPIGLSPWFLLVIFLGYLNMLYRLKYVQEISFGDVFLRALLVPEIIYSWAQIAVMIYSYYLSFFEKKQEWHSVG